MIRYEEVEKNLKEGQVLKCIELVTNDENEIGGVDIYIIEDNEDRQEKLEELNKYNQDKRFKYIAIDYTVKKDVDSNFYLEV